MIELRPCPFCGSKNIDPEGWASVVRKGPACDDCGSSADTVKNWNRRPEEDWLRAAVEAIKKATIEGRVCDDVAWFDTITTLHDFCDQTLNRSTHNG